MYFQWVEFVTVGTSRGGQNVAKQISHYLKTENQHTTSSRRLIPRRDGDWTTLPGALAGRLIPDGTGSSWLWDSSPLPPVFAQFARLQPPSGIPSLTEDADDCGTPNLTYIVTHHQTFYYSNASFHSYVKVFVEITLVTWAYKRCRN